jgi:dye decolorizing peroxidase
VAGLVPFAGDPSGSAPAAGRPARVGATGVHQAGITAPLLPQPHLLLVVFDLLGPAGAALARMGSTIEGLTGDRSRPVYGHDPGDLTVTVGIGPRLVASIDPTLPGAVALPLFGHEDLVEACTGGDVMVQICASDPHLPAVVAAAVESAADGMLEERWRQAASRTRYCPVDQEGFAPRDVIGFIDGIVVPRSPVALEDDVWLPGPSRVAGGTVAVIRRMEVDLGRFSGLSVPAQERVIGRRRRSGAPLSGGGTAATPDLGATDAAGQYRIPLDAHVRWASPGMNEVPTMLRRSYSFADGGHRGLLFVSFQNDLDTFTTTLGRMEAHDALLDYTMTTASASFLVLPGFGPDRPLGHTLFAS